MYLCFSHLESALKHGSLLKMEILHIPLRSGHLQPPPCFLCRALESETQLEIKHV